MPSLARREAEALLVVAESALAGTDPDSWWTVVDQEILGDLLGADALMTVGVDVEAGVGRFAFVEPAELEADVPVGSAMPLGLIADHPLRFHYQDPSAAPVIRSSDVTSVRAWRATQAGLLLREISGASGQLAIAVDTYRSRRLIISPLRAGEFTEHDCEVAERLRLLVRVADRHVQVWDELRGRHPGLVGEARTGVRLTPRESLVLALMAEGMLAVTIGRRLGISVRTVHRHQANVYDKLGVHDRLGAVLQGQRLGLLGGPDVARTRHHGLTPPMPDPEVDGESQLLRSRS